MSVRKNNRLAQSRGAPLNLSAEAFRQTGHQLVDQLADFYAALPERPITSFLISRATDETSRCTPTFWLMGALSAIT